MHPIPAPDELKEAGVPTLEAIRAAAARIAPYALATPLLENSAINALTGARILFKPEVLQPAGSFKYRGACNRLLQLDETQRKAGVVAFSSGNHALAISLVARQLGIPATIIMPLDAPRTKIDGARANGATVRLYDRKTDDREAIGREIAGPTGAVIVPPYDDRDIMTGQATAGLEIVEAAQALGLRIDAVLAACSGGGLVAGVASAVRQLSPATEVYAVEPVEFNELQRSLASGQPETNPAGASSICDALLVPTPGRLTFAVNRRLLAGSLTVSDDEVRAAMRVAFTHLKLVVEPGGAVGLAAVLSKRLALEGRTIVVVLSGGNVDADLFAGALQP